MKRVFPLVVLLLPVLASAQGLGDAAKRERQKRQVVPPAEGSRVYDNQDLDQGKPPKKAGDPEPAAPAATPPAEQQTPDDAREAQMLERVTAAERVLAEAEARLAAVKSHVQELKDKLNPMSPSYVFGNAGVGMAAPGADMRVREELQQAEADQIEAQKAVDDARRAVEDAKVRRPASAAR